MQFAKDSFYIALRDRLAALNPARTVTIEGVVRPAVYVVENEPVTAAVAPPEAFAITFGACKELPKLQSSRRPMLSLECEIEYHTAGTDANLSADRGRTLAALDQELLQICSPPLVAKQNYTGSPAVNLGTQVLWLRPQFSLAVAVGNDLQRKATTVLFFSPEFDY